MFRLFLKTIPNSLNLLASLSLAILLIKILYLNKISEIFEGAHKLGVVFEGILTSILASYIFYLIVVHLKETRDRAIIYPYITKWAGRVICECNEQLKILNKMDKNNKKDLSLYEVKKEDLKELFHNIDLNSDAPIDPFAYPFAQTIETRLSWIQCFELHRQHSKQYINKCMVQLIHLKTETEAELVEQLTEIDNCRYFSVIENLKQGLLEYPPIYLLPSAFYEYVVACRKLNDDLKKYDSPSPKANHYSKVKSKS